MPEECGEGKLNNMNWEQNYNEKVDDAPEEVILAKTKQNKTPQLHNKGIVIHDNVNAKDNVGRKGYGNLSRQRKEAWSISQIIQAEASSACINLDNFL